MSGLMVAPRGAVLTVNGTANGVITLASTLGYYVGARLWLSSGTQSSIECFITAVSGLTLTLRNVATIGYGTTNVSAYLVADTARVDMASQFVMNAVPLGFSDFFVWDGATLTPTVTLAGGSGTVTSVSVTTANGVSGSVATATTTPAITLTLGAITPTSITASGVLTVNATSNTVGAITVAAVATPVNATFSTATTGGSLAAGTYYYRVTAVNAAGETLASTETSQVVPAGTATNTVTVNWGAVTGATSYNVYGRTTGAETKITASIGTTGTTYIDTGSALSGALPVVNSTGGVNAANIVAITQTVGASHAQGLVFKNSNATNDWILEKSTITSGTLVLGAGGGPHTLWDAATGIVSFPFGTTTAGAMASTIASGSVGVQLVTGAKLALGSAGTGILAYDGTGVSVPGTIITGDSTTPKITLSNATGSKIQYGTNNYMVFNGTSDISTANADAATTGGLRVFNSTTLTVPGSAIAQWINNSVVVARVDKAGFISSATPHPVGLEGSTGKRCGTYEAITTAATTHTAIGLPTATLAAAETASAAPTQTGGTRMLIQHASSAVINTAGGIIGPYTSTRSLYRPRLSAVILTDAAITLRSTWIAITESDLSLVLVPTAAVASGVDYVALAFNTAVSANWLLCSGDGTNHSSVDTGVPVVAATEYRLVIDWTTLGTLRGSVNGTAVNKTTNLSVAAVDMGIQATVTSLDVGVSKAQYIGPIALEQN